MRGRHSIRRRWGRYQEQGIEEMSFFIYITLDFLCKHQDSSETEKVDKSCINNKDKQRETPWRTKGSLLYLLFLRIIM